MKRALLVAAIVMAGTALTQAATLDTVKQRGSLVCGVSTGFAGFSTHDSQGNFRGLDADYCRAIAAAVLGDATKVRFVALTAQNRFTALQSGEIDVTLGDYARAHNISWQPVVFERVDTMYQAFFAGRCDAMTQDASALAGAVATAAPNPADYVILSQTISKEPLGPFTRNGDEQWSNIVAWVHYGLIEAAEAGD